MNTLPYHFARRFGIVCQPQEGALPVLRCKTQTTIYALLEAQAFVQTPCTVERIEDQAFDAMLEQFYHSQIQGTLDQSSEEAADLETAAQALQHVEDVLDTAQEAPIIRLINALIAQALKNKASDIHIETYPQHLVFRFRQDGILKTHMQLPGKLAPLIISRIKIMANLNIAEKRLPQDGRISVQLAGRKIDVRVSTLPSQHGERIVLRLLDKQNTALKLEELGLLPADITLMRQLQQKPHGIILVTGPTGAGKTTTLYAFLNELNDHKRNILTVEDPIEYELPGIGQSPVNAKIGMTFARGLRAILRQDPDIVMVGEIRDLETAEIAIQASLTGHLMLSTLHTNTAIGAVTRLKDMGVAPYLIASTLEGLIAQRLVRQLCPACKSAFAAPTAIKTLLAQPLDRELTLYQANGCAECDHTGYCGRIGIYEIILVDDGLKQLIHDNVPEKALTDYAHQRFSSIRQAAIARVLHGDTTIEEILRVTDTAP